jgi:hypothetical protein
MGKHKPSRNKLRLLRSRRAIALPITFLILFVSLVLLVTVTYYFSISRISAKSLELKVSGAEQEMISLEKIIKFVSWSPGSYQIYEFGDFGGKLRVLPAAKTLVLTITDGTSFQEVFFDHSVGEVLYELPPSDSQENVFLTGDIRAVINQSSATMAQLYTSPGEENYEMALSYRPLAGATVTGSSNGKPVNSLRVYVISLDSSENITRSGSFRLKITCANVTSNWRTYDFSNSITSLLIKASLDDASGQVLLPISSNAQGAIVNLETITCSIKLEDAGW